MSKNPIIDAIKAAAKKNLTVQKIEIPKPKKSKDNPYPVMHSKPLLYVDDKEIPSITKYKAGDKVILVCECTVGSTSNYENMREEKAEKRSTADLEIDAYVDIT